MAHRSHTAHAVGIVFAVLASLLLLVGSYRLQDEHSELQNDRARAARDAKDAEERSQALAEERQRLQELVAGRHSARGYDELIREANALHAQLVDATWITDEDLASIRDPEVRQLWERLREQGGDSERFASLAQLGAELPDQLRAAVHVVPRLRLDRIRARAEVRALLAKEEALRGSLIEEGDRVRADLRASQREGATFARRSEDELAELRRRRVALRRERERLEKAHGERVEEGMADLARLRLELDRLRARHREVAGAEEAPVARGAAAADPDLPRLPYRRSRR